MRVPPQPPSANRVMPLDPLGLPICRINLISTPFVIHSGFVFVFSPLQPSSRPCPCPDVDLRRYNLSSTQLA